MDTSYEGGGRHRETCWWKMVARKHLRDTLENIFAAERVRRREYDRSDKGRGREEVAESEPGSKGSRYA